MKISLTPLSVIKIFYILTFSGKLSLIILLNIAVFSGNQKREGPQKRQLGRHPRIPFTTQQLSILEDKFRKTPYLSSSEVTKLSRSLQLADIRVS